MAASILIAFGFGWMVVGALLGLYLGAKQPHHLEELKAAASEGNLAVYHRVSDVYKWRTTVHTHAMLFSLSSVGVGFVLARHEFGSVSSEALAGALMLATIVWSLASLRQIRPLMALADVLFLVSIASVAIIVATNL